MRRCGRRGWAPARPRTPWQPRVRPPRIARADLLPQRRAGVRRRAARRHDPVGPARRSRLDALAAGFALLLGAGHDTQTVPIDTVTDTIADRDQGVARD